jgi:peptide/nickel transport system ATP-binding protein
MADNNTPVVDVRDLKIHFTMDEGILKAVDGVDFAIPRSGALGLVGESGCGKSVTAHSLLHIIPPNGKLYGDIFFHRSKSNGGGATADDPDAGDGDAGETLNLAKLNPRGNQIRAIRGKEISMIFQEPMTSFSPVHTIGHQIMEAILLHRTDDKHEAREIAIEMLDKVGIANPGQRVDEYPAQLSGGMRQRAMIAMALSCNPQLLIADEPTTALDVTVQAQVLELMASLQTEFGTAILFITHDLGVIAEMVDQVAVMYLGEIVEFGSTIQIFDTPLHPYTKALLRSIPQLGKTVGQRLASIKGTVPLPIGLPEQCPFHSRCTECGEECEEGDPPVVEVEEGHRVKCFHYETAVRGE